MQQRGANMEAGGEEVEEQPPPSRGRPASKLKVLGRSHAMREEQSPPREPNCADNHTSGGQLHSPPTVVLSPSPLDEESSAISGAGSPATLVASPNSRCSSLCDSNGGCERLHPAEADLPPSPKYINGKNGTANNSSQVGSKSSKRYCECQNQNCIKCVKDRGGTNNNHSNTNNNTSLLYVNKNRGKLKQQSSSQTNLSFESYADSSAEYYTDTTGVDLEQFIPDTINRNPKDRALMLRIEEELVSLINDKFQTHYKFPPMTSYHRMLVHRCAAYFGMDHNIDQSGKCIVVNKTKNTRLPDVRFKEHVKEVFNDEPPRRSILKRDSNSIEDYCFKSPERGYGLEGRRSKSFEEREEEYERARRRIFRGDIHDSSEDFGWDMQWSSTESDYSRYRLQPPEFQSRQLRRLLKVHSEEAEQSMRPCVAKSYSFGGYGGASVSLLTRGDSVISTHSAPVPRLLTKQDSGASSVSWRLSPSSSGYKSQSQMSESVTPSPTSTPHPPGEEHHHKNANPVVWAVTDLSNVPRGSIIINPETGKPFKNEDGTIYYYDPVKPAPGLVPEESLKAERAQSPQKDKTPPLSPKGEKKHSPLKTKSSFTNSATSPSLPFSPPLSTPSSGVAMNRSFSYIQTVNSCENVVSALGPTQQQQQQQYSNFPNQQADGNMPVYPQPYIVYTAAPGYGVPVHQPYDTRLDQQNIPEMSTTFFVPEAASASGAAQTITYQSPSSGPFWNQPAAVGFYTSGTQPPVQSGAQPRYSVQVPAQPQTTYVSAGYPPAVNYVAAQAGPAQVPSAEIVPVYPNQSMQMVYSQPTGTVMYQNQPLIYAQNPTTLYQTTAYQAAPAYPHGTPTPTGGIAPLPSTPLEQATPNGFVQLAQNMQQMNLGSSQSSTPRGFVPIHPKCGHPFDPRRPSFSKPPSGGYTGKPGRFPMGSSQSSTGTSSPAATVVAPGYCPTLPPPGHYRTPPPSTPPTPQFAVFGQGGYPTMGPRLFRQMSAERGTTPGTAKSSRSPTPAGDAGTHFERQRFTFPPSFYPGMPMPYIIQSDPRLVGRGQPNIYRQPTPPAMHNRPVPTQGPDMRSHYNNYKNRKPKLNKGLPPSGK